MRDVLADFKGGPHGIFLPLFNTHGALFVKQTRESEGLVNMTLITDTALLVSNFLSAFQPEGICFAVLKSDFGSNVNAVTGKSADAVHAVFSASYGGSPSSPYLAHARDAKTLLLSAPSLSRWQRMGNGQLFRLGE